MTSWIFLAAETMIQNEFCEHYFTRQFSGQFRKAAYPEFLCNMQEQCLSGTKGNTRFLGPYLYS